jgi:replication factor C subunit 3/5
MVLLVDSCRPRTFDGISIHRDVCNNLQRLVANGNYPHIVFYGPSGAGKHTLVSALLREIYGPGADKQKVEFRSFKTSSTSSTTVDIRIISSLFHVELAPSEVGNKDTIVIQQMIKELAQSPPLGNYPFKTVVISDADCLSKQAQAGLRRTMEKYSSFCRIILIAESLSRLIPPIRSRCLPVRVRAPDVEEIDGLLSKSINEEGIRIPAAAINEIVANCDRDLRRAYLLVDCARNVNHGTSSQFDIKKTMSGSWEDGVDWIVSAMIQEQTPRKLLEVRNKLYDLLSLCIPADAILSKITRKLLQRVPEILLSEVISAAAECSHLLRLGSKDIFHLEYFCVQFMAMYRSKCT